MRATTKLLAMLSLLASVPVLSAVTLSIPTPKRPRECPVVVKPIPPGFWKTCESAYAQALLEYKHALGVRSAPVEIAEGLLIACGLLLLSGRRWKRLDPLVRVPLRRILLGVSAVSAAIYITFVYSDVQCAVACTHLMTIKSLDLPFTGYWFATFIEGGQYVHGSLGTVAALPLAAGILALGLYYARDGLRTGMTRAALEFSSLVLLLEVLLAIYDENEMYIQVIYPLRDFRLWGIYLASNWTVLTVTVSIMAIYIKPWRRLRKPMQGPDVRRTAPETEAGARALKSSEARALWRVHVPRPRRSGPPDA